MSKEIILKKLEQITQLLTELEKLLGNPFAEFVKDFVILRAAERNFQLIVDLASDINTQVLLERGRETPDTYRQSFSELLREGILDEKLTDRLVASAQLRNILVHEYDFDEDYKKFYQSAKDSIPAFRAYIRVIHSYVT